jgi:regulator of sirC expression with transglutaminase-like and TPR domain
VHEAEAAFRQLVADPTAVPPLDEGALLIAAVATGADVDAGLARLDDLASDARADGRDPAGLARHLFVERGFAGNTLDYADPRNSFLPDVIDRRLGIPISLSVLMIEVGRRIGIGLHGVGMPGHFLVGVDATPGLFFDPFHAGAALDADGAQELFARLQGPDAGFRAGFLAPTPTRQVLLRMLANLQQTYVARRAADARWVARLRLAFPELSVGERGQAAEVLASVGAFDEAAAVLDAMVDDAADADARTALGRRAVAYRSRSN